MFYLAILLIAGSGFFVLRAATSRRLQVESTLGRIPGYGYHDDDRSNDPRAWLRRGGRVAPRGRRGRAAVPPRPPGGPGGARRATARGAGGGTRGPPRGREPLRSLPGV